LAALKTPATANPYVPAWSAFAGTYYLSNGCPFVGAGTTSIDPALLAQLRTKTTYPPLAYPSFPNSETTVLAPVVQRDTTGLTLGWHYDPIDYMGVCAISNATLLLTNGVVLGLYGNSLMWLEGGTQLISQGAPNQRNYLVYWNGVQEWPTYPNLYPLSGVLLQQPAAFGHLSNPFIFLRLTSVCAPTGETVLWQSEDSPLEISGLTLQDCEIYGSGAAWQMNESANTPVVGFTNNIFHRVPFAVNSAAKITSYNNLFAGRRT